MVLAPSRIRGRFAHVADRAKASEFSEHIIAPRDRDMIRSIFTATSPALPIRR